MEINWTTGQNANDCEGKKFAIIGGNDDMSATEVFDPPTTDQT